MQFHARRFGVLGAALACLTSPAAASDASPQAQGAAIAARDCGGCHAVGPDGASPFREAPAFRTLGERYDVGDLEESLAEGISVGHPMMPAKPYPPEDVVKLIAYLRGIQASPPPLRGR